MKIIIPGQTIAKKNSQRVVKMGKRHSIRPSKAYEKYAKSAISQINWEAEWEGGYPCIVEMYFYRETMRSFDLDNMQGSILDILVGAGLIKDDSMNHVIPKIRDHGWEKDNKNPRAEVVISKYKKLNKELI